MTAPDRELMLANVGAILDRHDTGEQLVSPQSTHVLGTYRL